MESNKVSGELSVAQRINSQSGYLTLKSGRFFGKEREYWFELDELNDYVNYYKKEPSSDALQNSMIGSFTLEGATITKEEDKKSGDHKIIIKLKKGKTLTIGAKNDQIRNEWYEAFSKAATLAKDSKDLLAEWNKEEICNDIRCVAPTFDDSGPGDEEEEIENEVPDFYSLQVQDTSGKSVDIRTIIGKKAIVLMLLRHFGCMLCRMAVGRMLSIKPQLDELGIEIVAIGNGAPEHAKVFAKEQGFAGRIYVDQKRKIYKSLCCVRGMRYAITSKTLTVAKVAFQEGYRQGSPTGDMLQLGGVFILTPSGLLFKHVEQYAGQLVDLNLVLNTCVEYTLSKDTWTSRPRRPHEWTDIEDKNVLQTILKTDSKLFRYELGQSTEFWKKVLSEREISIDDLDSNVLHYAEAIASGPQINLLSYSKESTNVGPVIVSIENPSPLQGDRKAIIFTKKSNYRMLIPEQHVTQKEILKFIATKKPDFAPLSFTKVDNPDLIEDLLEFEKVHIFNKYKFGVLPMTGTQSEDDMYSIEHSSPALEEFLECISTKIQLQGWPKYRGGLDTKKNTTGTHSYYSEFSGFEIMFHVSPMLPYQAHDPQRVERKRHLGNDVVLIIFNESNSPFDPCEIHSHFNHLFFVVQPSKNSSGETVYKLALACKSAVPAFGPYLPTPTEFVKGSEFRNFFLTKLINGERAAMICPEFSRRSERTRKDHLNNILEKYIMKETSNNPVTRTSSLKHSPSTQLSIPESSSDIFANIIKLSKQGITAVGKQAEIERIYKEIYDIIGKELKKK